MKLFHGSKTVITLPKCKGSNIYNDYGPSFYLTDDLNSAKSWACKNEEVGKVNVYEISITDFNNLKVLDLTDKASISILNWLAILMHFRQLDTSFSNLYKQRIQWLEKYYINVEDYDVIKGFRADDSYFQFPLSFINGTLSYEDLIDVYKLGNLGIQYAFMSEKSLSKLKFKASIECEEEYVGKYYSIVRTATNEFKAIITKPLDISKTYITDLMRNDIKRIL